jgi:hypothetical protein
MIVRTGVFTPTAPLVKKVGTARPLAWRSKRIRSSATVEDAFEEFSERPGNDGVELTPDRPDLDFAVEETV